MTITQWSEDECWSKTWTEGTSAHPEHFSLLILLEERSLTGGHWWSRPALVAY